MLLESKYGCLYEIISPESRIASWQNATMRAPGGPGADSLVKPCDLHLQESLQLAERMIALSFQGDQDREDTGCGIIYGVMRDAGFRLKQLVTREIENHRLKSGRKTGPGGSSSPDGASSTLNPNQGGIRAKR